MRFDFSSLAYLVEKGNDTLFARLVDVKAKYHELRRLLEDHNLASAERIAKFGATGWVNQEIPHEKAAEGAVGVALQGRLQSLASALEDRVGKQAQVYRDAGEALEAAALIRFKSDVFHFRALGVKAELVTQPYG